MITQSSIRWQGLPISIALLLSMACSSGTNAAPTKPASDQTAPAKASSDKAGKAVKTTETAQPATAAKTAEVAKAKKKTFAELPFKIQYTQTAASKGEASKTAVTVIPLDGYKMNKDFPNSLNLNPATDAQLAKTKYSPADARLTDQALTFGIDFTPAAVGSTQFSGTANFSVCNESTCKLFRGEKLAWTVPTK
mgnify:CR=1 FL=1